MKSINFRCQTYCSPPLERFKGFRPSLNPWIYPLSLPHLYLQVRDGQDGSTDRIFSGPSGFWSKRIASGIIADFSNLTLQLPRPSSCPPPIYTSTTLHPALVQGVPEVLKRKKTMNYHLWWDNAEWYIANVTLYLRDT